MNRALKRHLILVALILALAVSPNAESGQVLRTGCCLDSLSSLEKRDVEAALDILLGKMVKNARPGTTHELILMPDSSGLPRELEKGGMDIVDIRSTEYLDLKDRFGLIPAMVTIKNGKATEQYLLLVRSERVVEGLDHLAGGKLIISATGHGTLARLWLDTMLLRTGRPPIERYFSKVKTVAKPSQAVLPVFFGQADACLVSSGAFQLLTELNPQVGRQLEYLEQSDELLVHLTCYLGEPSEGVRDIIENISPRVSQDPDGQQLLTIFQVEDLGLYTPDMISGVEALYKDYRRLLAGDPGH